MLLKEEMVSENIANFITLYIEEKYFYHSNKYNDNKALFLTTKFYNTLVPQMHFQVDFNIKRTQIYLDQLLNGENVFLENEKIIIPIFYEGLKSSQYYVYSCVLVDLKKKTLNYFPLRKTHYNNPQNETPIMNIFHFLSKEYKRK